MADAANLGLDSGLHVALENPEGVGGEKAALAHVHIALAEEGGGEDPELEGRQCGWGDVGGEAEVAGIGGVAVLEDFVVVWDAVAVGVDAVDFGAEGEFFGVGESVFVGISVGDGGAVEVAAGGGRWGGDGPDVSRGKGEGLVRERPGARAEGGGGGELVVFSGDRMPLEEAGLGGAWGEAEGAGGWGGAEGICAGDGFEEIGDAIAIRVCGGELVREGAAGGGEAVLGFPDVGHAICVFV